MTQSPVSRPALSRAGRLLVPLAGALLAAAASAQVPGTYTGLNAQGFTMQVIVQPAPGGGTEVSQISAGYRLACAETGAQMWLSSVVSGHFPVDAGGAFDATWLWDKDHFRTTGQFAPDGSVQGQTEWTIPAVAAPAPHAAELCGSAPQAWSGSRTAAARQMPAEAPAQMPHWRLERRLDRQGRVVFDRLERLR